MTTINLEGWARRVRILSAGLICLGVVALSATFIGCSRAFPTSPTIRQITLQSLIPKNAADDPDMTFGMGSGEHVNPEYVYREYEITLKVPPSEQKDMVSKIKLNFSDAVKRVGAEVNGEGFRGDWGRTVTYQGKATVGEFHLFAQPIGETNLKVLLIQFECLRR